MKRPRLTAREKEAVCMILNEFFAGNDAETFAAKFGISEKEAERRLALLDSALTKLEHVSA